MGFLRRDYAAAGLHDLWKDGSLDPRSAGLYWITTREAWQRRGVGTAMTLAALRDARALGYELAVLQATQAGSSVYHRLGFRAFCTVPGYLWVG